MLTKVVVAYTLTSLPIFYVHHYWSTNMPPVLVLAYALPPLLLPLVDWAWRRLGLGKPRGSDVTPVLPVVRVRSWRRLRMSSAADPEALRRHLHRLTVLHQASTRIVSALEPDKVLAEALDSLKELVAHRSAAIHLADAEPASGEPAVDGATLVIPLVARGHTLGSLEITLAAPLDVDDLTIVELLAATAAVALQNAHLYQETQRLATTDPLTGLSNYRHFYEQLALEVQRARRMRYAVGLLDHGPRHFKQINDRHGHPVGDRALQRVGELLRKRLRRTDVVGRVGGEEFAVILPGRRSGPDRSGGRGAAQSRRRPAAHRGRQFRLGTDADYAQHRWHVADARDAGYKGADRLRGPGPVRRQTQGPQPGPTVQPPVTATV